MAEAPDNLLLVLLRRIDERTDRIAADLHDVKVRLSHVEEGLAGVNRRIDRIERRLDLVNAS